MKRLGEQEKIPYPLQIKRYGIGGGGGSRTPVRKRFLGNFSGRRRSFTFPCPGVGRQTTGLGSFIVHGALKALRTHGHHSTTPHPGSWSFRAGRSRLKPRQAQRYRCSLIYKLPIFRMLGASARYSRLYVPVETSTPPCRRKVHFTRNILSGIPRFISLLLHFQTNPLALGFAWRPDSAKSIPFGTPFWDPSLHSLAPHLPGEPACAGLRRERGGHRTYPREFEFVELRNQHFSGAG